jgi:hypothetical protein
MYIRMYWDGDEGDFITQLNQTRNTKHKLDSRKKEPGIRNQEWMDGDERENCRLAGRLGCFGWAGLDWIMDMLMDTDTVYVK